MSSAETQESILSSLACFLDRVLEDETLLFSDDALRRIKISFSEITTAVSPDKDHVFLIGKLRTALEKICLQHLRSGRAKDFEKTFASLQCVYEDFPPPILPTSSVKPQLVAIQMTKLLVDGLFGDFHILYQKLSSEDRKHPNVEFVSLLERSIMAGNYNKSLSLINSPPHECFEPYCSKLLINLRIRLAHCIGKSHYEISVQRAKELFMLKKDEDLVNFINHMNARDFSNDATETFCVTETPDDLSETMPGKESRAPWAQERVEWILDGQWIRFSQIINSEKIINYSQVIKNVLEYTAEIEKIV